MSVSTTVSLHLQCVSSFIRLLVFCFFVCSIIPTIQPSFAWLIRNDNNNHHYYHRTSTTSSSTTPTITTKRQNTFVAVPRKSSTNPTTTTTTSLFAGAVGGGGGGPLPDGYKEFGEFIIRKAGRECGIQKDEDLTIEWKAGKIIVTVRTDAYASASSDDEDENDEGIELDDDDDDDADIEDDIDDDNDEEEEEDVDDEGDDEDENDNNDDDLPPPPLPPKGIDLTQLARAINNGLDDRIDGDGIGFAIAEVHEIEVTTPGASDELVGKIMFEAYKGFDVICEQIDNKTKKVKQINGRLVERNDEFTIINIKGRMKKMKNNTVLSVKLPKAKKEKGVK